MGLSNVTGASSILQPGVCTSSTRPASPYDGQVIYETDTDKVAVYDSSSWVYKTGTAHIAPALVLIKTQTIGTTVSSVTVSSAFSSTYDNYLITLAGGVTSANSALRMILGATATGYYSGGIYNIFSSASTTASNQNNATFWTVGAGVSTSLSTNIVLYSPNLAKRTLFEASYIAAISGGDYGRNGGFLDDATAYTAFTLTNGSGTMTGGTVRVYGYQNS